MTACNYPNCDGGPHSGYCHVDCREAPQQLIECNACDGSGVEVFGTWVYEHGCGYGHNSTDERPCGKCNGNGWWIE